MWPLYNRAHKHDSDDMAVTPALLFALTGIRLLHQQCKPRLIWQLANCCPTATLILDARGTINKQWGSEYLGAFLVCGSIKEYYMVPVSAWGIEDWLGKGQVRINESETINVLVALCTWRHHLRGC